MECILLCAWHVLFMYFVSCAYMHWAILTAARLLFINLFFFDKSSFVSICYVVPPIHMRLMCHSCMCVPTNGFQQPVHSAPSVFRAKSAGSKSQLHSKHSLAHSRGGRGAKGESLVHIVCACANYLGYHGCGCYPRKYMGVSIMGVYKNTKIPKNVLENLWICWACCSTHHCKRLFTWTIIGETSGNIINTMLQCPKFVVHDVGLGLVTEQLVLASW